MGFPKQCLFIDDDSDDQDFFCEAVSQIDPSIVCISAANGTEALEKLADPGLTPDVIFIDMNMPKMSGRETLIEIRKMERLQKTPIYMYSTVAAPKTPQEMLNLGATDFLIKPSTMSNLQQLLEKILN